MVPIPCDDSTLKGKRPELVSRFSFVTETSFKARFDSSAIVLLSQSYMVPENKPQRGPTTLVGCDVVECVLIETAKT
jgi:hypothetical protein